MLSLPVALRAAAFSLAEMERNNVPGGEWTGEPRATRSVNCCLMQRSNDVHFYQVQIDPRPVGCTRTQPITASLPNE